MTDKLIKRIILGFLIVIAILFLRMMSPAYGKQMVYSYGHSDVDVCLELKYEQGSLLHILDAMNQDQTAEAHKQITEDFIQSVRRVLFYNLLCNYGY